MTTHTRLAHAGTCLRQLLPFAMLLLVAAAEPTVSSAQSNPRSGPVSCPAAKPGTVLSTVTVKLMPSGQELAPTEGDDSGVDWDLPRFHEGEFATLNCTYAKRHAVTRDGRAIEVSSTSLRIPLTAKACRVTHDPDRATCSDR